MIPDFTLMPGGFWPIYLFGLLFWFQVKPMLTVDQELALILGGGAMLPESRVSRLGTVVSGFIRRVAAGLGFRHER